ncbi:helix-turn-helix domain-containing protein [Microcella pacifica]|uniref:Helix-turn-helix transcriptional regulator n=1 Tax=Microcella pacifica TaxID=2591847 RepID=A0A9E5JRQ7_9MICO|nr:helix-turn-helix transcriptional regulator [Microcella pacifica]NHF63746.1 helix-turn-helix transcriptional regulator [Microcella pacifica]
MPERDEPRTPDFAELRFFLARMRRERRLTLEQLAERSGIGRRSLVQLESGESRGTLATWFAVAEGLDVEIGVLVSALYGPGRERRVK